MATAAEYDIDPIEVHASVVEAPTEPGIGVDFSDRVVREGAHVRVDV